MLFADSVDLVDLLIGLIE